MTSRNLNLINEIRSFSTAELVNVLEKNGLHDCCHVITDKQINGESFLQLQESELVAWRAELNYAQRKRLWSIVLLANERPQDFHSSTAVMATAPKVNKLQSTAFQHLNNLFATQKIEDPHGGPSAANDTVEYVNVPSSRPPKPESAPPIPRPPKPESIPRLPKPESTPAIPAIQIPPKLLDNNFKLPPEPQVDNYLQMDRDYDPNAPRLPPRPISKPDLADGRGTLPSVAGRPGPSIQSQTPTLPPLPAEFNHKPQTLFEKLAAALKAKEQSKVNLPVPSAWDKSMHVSSIQARALPPIPTEDRGFQLPRLPEPPKSYLPKPPEQIHRAPSVPKDLDLSDADDFDDDIDDAENYDYLEAEQPSYMSEPWFRHVDRKEARRILVGSESGSFIVRPSNKPEQVCSMTIHHNNNFFNVAINKQRNGKLSIGMRGQDKKGFDTVEEIVQHYTTAPLHFTTSDHVKVLIYLKK